jgi:hypothetical protein
MLSDLAEGTRNTIQQPSPLSSQVPTVEDDDLELLSRRDVPWTPITGSDMILAWSVFPQDKPASTFPASAYTQKPNPYALGKCKSLDDRVSRVSFRCASARLLTDELQRLQILHLGACWS